VDLSDTENFIASVDNVIDYARRRGWWSPKKDGPFDFSKAYRTAKPDFEALAKRRFDLRQWRGLSLLAGRSLSEKDAEENGLPFSLKPGHPVGVQDVMGVLRDHFEGTAYAAVRSDTTNPHCRCERPICYRTTLLSIVAELQPWMPAPLRARLWVAFGRPDTSPYTPWYASITETPAPFRNTPGIVSPDSAFSRHFDPVPGTFAPDTAAAFWILKRLADLVNIRYFNRIGMVRDSLQAFELPLPASQDAFEKTAIASCLNAPDRLPGLLTGRTRSLAESSLERVKEITRRLPAGDCRTSEADGREAPCSSTESTSD
jgi:dipeptidase